MLERHLPEGRKIDGVPICLSLETRRVHRLTHQQLRLDLPWLLLDHLLLRPDHPC